MHGCHNRGELVVLQDLDAGMPGECTLVQPVCPERDADLPLYRAVVDLPHGACIRLFAWTRADLHARRELLWGMVGG